MSRKFYPKAKIFIYLLWLAGSLFFVRISQLTISVYGGLNIRSQSYEIDVFTQYPAPYGGQGKNMPSDSFFIGKTVILYTQLTNESELIRNRSVTVELKGPQNVTQFLACTNTSGIATVRFTIPNQESMFGIWNATSTFPVGDVNQDEKIDMQDVGRAARAFGSLPGEPEWNPNVDINKDNKVDMRDIGLVAENFGQTVIYDKLTFKVGYVLRLIAFETCDEFGNPKTVFAHDEPLCFNVTIKSISIMTKNVTIFIVAYDELGVVFSTISQNFSIPTNNTVELFILGPIIPKYAFSGTGKAGVNAFQPGTTTPYCPPISTTYVIWM